jgi:hypothetical protein
LAEAAWEESNALQAVSTRTGILGVVPALSAALTPDASLIVAGPLAKRRPVIRNANKVRYPAAPRFMLPLP